MENTRYAERGRIKNTIQISEGLYLIQFIWGHVVACIGEEGVLLVDSQFEEASTVLDAKLQELGGGDVKFVINTHWHDDHTMGNKYFGKRGAVIIAHENTRRTLSTYQELIGLGGEVQKFPPMPEYALPKMTFKETLTIHFNGEEIRLLHFPYGADTDGDIIVWLLHSNVVVMGDLYYNGMFPWIDFERGGDAVGRANALKSALSILPGNVKIVPGHGAISNFDELKNTYEMMTESIAIVFRQMKEGLSIDDMQKEGLPEQFKGWDPGNYVSESLWIEFIYRSIRGKGIV